MGEDRAEASGWSLLAEHDGAAALVGAVLELDPDETYTKRELSEAADVAFKQLYLDGTLSAVVETGLLARTDDDGGEARYVIEDGSRAYEAARRFGEAVAGVDPVEP
ncbi:MAG: hypothetical protein ABEJ89_00805 [Haloarculaceae archaeon]